MKIEINLGNGFLQDWLTVRKQKKRCYKLTEKRDALIIAIKDYENDQISDRTNALTDAKRLREGDIMS